MEPSPPATAIDPPRLDPDSTPSQGRGRMRWLVRGLCLLAAAGLLLPALDRPGLALVVPALSPFLTLASLTVTRAFEASMLLGMAVGLVAIVRRRWFCRWMCPTGFCTDGASRIGRRLGLRGPRLPALGPWIALATLAGACLGYPLLLWLDPLAMFAGLFSLAGPQREAAVGWSAIGVPAVVLLSLLLPGIWCSRLCPLGAVQDLLADLAGLACRLTVLKGQPQAESGWRLGRRVLLGATVGAIGAAATRKARAAVSGPLRPPGACKEAVFTGLCVRCGNCVRVCPTAILSPDLGGHGLAGLLAPALRFETEYCREDCVRCTEVCPSGAIRRLTVTTKGRGPIGLPRVDMSICLLGEDRECAVCRNRCPYEAITLVFSEAEYTLTPRIDAEKCPGCGACEAACPTRPVKAITVRPR